MSELNLKTPIKLEDNGILKYISGGILEQVNRFDIKLTNGSINLKAGSNVVHPHNQSDSREKFEVVEVLSDVTLNSGGTTTENYLLFYDATYTNIVNMPLTSCFSGTSYPTIDIQHAIFYDETNNVIEETLDGGSTWEVMDYSFPIAYVERVSGTYNKIQKLNKASFIGRAIFMDNLIVALPNGYDKDGSCGYIKKNISKQVKVVAQTEQDNYCLSASSDGVFKSYNRYLEAETYDNAGSITLWNNTAENHMYYMNTSNVAEERHEYPVCYYDTDGTRIIAIRDVGVLKFKLT